MLNIPTLQQLLEAGVHFGHRVSRGHPKMAEFIYGAKEGVHIIDLEKSQAYLRKAAEFVYQLGEEGKVLLFVGTKKQAQPIIKETAEKAGAPYVTYGWIGGTLTNFSEIRKNITKLLELKKQQQEEALGMYTKKEQLLIKKKLDKFDKSFGGISQMEDLPYAIFLADCVTEKTALREAVKKGIPIIGVVDTNANPQAVDYPIPANDDAVKSIKIMVETIAASYQTGLSGSKVKKAEAEEKKKEKIETGAEAKVPTEQLEVAEEKIEKEALKEAERKV